MVIDSRSGVQPGDELTPTTLNQNRNARNDKLTRD
jgi:hypothetical protein